MKAGITLVALAALAYILYTPLPHYFDEAPVSVRLFVAFQHKMRFLPDLVALFGGSAVHGMRMLWEPFKWLQCDPSDFGVLTTDASFGGVPVRVYQPQGGGPDKVGGIFFIHGGGFMLLDVATYDEFCARLAAHVHAVVVSVEYRRAPEFLFPTALDDCETALRHFAAHSAEWNVDSSRIGVAGDSAGGGLAASLAIRLRDALPLKFQLLFYPSVQAHNTTTLSARVNQHDFMLSRLIFAWRFLYLTGVRLPEQLQRAGYAGLADAGSAVLHNKHSLASPHVRRRIDQIVHPDLYDRIYSASDLEQLSAVANVGDFPQVEPTSFSQKERSLTDFYERFIFDTDYSPLMAPTFSRLPPAYIVVCEHDILRDDGLLYAERLKLADVAVHVQRYRKYHPYALLEPQKPVEDFAAFVHQQHFI